MTGVNGELQSSVERVLASETFRNSPSSRRLLKYLAERAAAGDADQIKEYTIGVDAFGKAPDYDPRLDSTVRIQIGRLRQKLADYYQGEGKDDAIVLDLPRGKFQLVGESRVESIPAVTPVPRFNKWRMAAVGLGAALVVSLIAIVVVLIRPPAIAKDWNADLEELWRPLIRSERPLIVAVGNPLFVQFENKALYRDLSSEKWEDLQRSPNLAAVAKALGSGENRPVYYYAAVGDVSAAFLLGQRLGARHPNMSVVRSSQLLWQQMADANVLFLGPPRFFGERLGSMPVSLEVTETADGFRVEHPRAGEQSLYKYRDPVGFLAEDGEACVLVTRTAGPEGNTSLVTFAGNSTFGRVGAVNAFTDAAFVHTLVQRMGRIPQYFQVLLRVRYKGGVPTETTYLLHRELHRR